MAAHELEEVTYGCDDFNFGSIVEWVGNGQPPLAVVLIDMQSPDHTQVYCRKGWSTRLWVGAISGILALRLIPREKTVESLPVILQGQGQGKPREGACPRG